MKKLKNLKNLNPLRKSFLSNFKLYKDIYKAGTMISLSNEYHLMSVLKEIGYRIVTLSLLSTKETSRFRMLHNFAKFLVKMTKNHGDVYTVKYLKASQLCIQKKLAGQPFKSMREVEPDYNLPRLSKSGLPVIIKLQDRAAICNDSLRITRLWLSIFSIYRVIKVPFNPKLATITDQFSGSHMVTDDFNRWLTRNSTSHLLRFSEPRMEDLLITKVLPIVKSSPLGTKSYSRLIDSYWSLKHNSVVFDAIKKYINLTKSINFGALFNNLEFLKKHYDIGCKGIGPIGKLSFKEEAAGKLRVFAMVDVITQSLLYPLHIQLFKLFKKIPNDCTHDQNKGFQLAQELSLKYNCSFGFDLSAATDRLPISSQEAILNSFYGIGKLWSTILVERDYIISKNDYSIPQQSLRYSVGQPMGALSSWAMLNLTHHMMIQFIAIALGKTHIGRWYDQYVILGDDLVLFDKDIANRYQSFCKDLGVGINLSKSIIAESKPVLEFAKRTSLNGEDVSALSFKELLSSNNFFGRLSVTTRLINNKWGKDLWKILLIGNRRSTDKTLDRIYPLVGFATQLFQSGKIPMNDVLSLITNKSKPLAFFGRNISWMKPGSISKVISSYLRTGKWSITSIPKKDRFFAAVNVMSIKLIMINRIENSIKTINNLNTLNNRLVILDRIITSKDLEAYYFELCSEGKSLDLTKPLYERWYWQDPKFLQFRKMFLAISPFSNIFFNNFSGSVTDLNLLRHGLDMDISYDTGRRLWSGVYELLYLNDFRNDKTKFLKSKKFLDLELDLLLKHHNELLSLIATLKFHEIKPDINKERLDNPLKILDFIIDLPNSKNSFNFEFVKFENQYLDSEAFSDIMEVKRSGFKPFFGDSFYRKPVIKITISGRKFHSKSRV
nr:MAG: putative RNA dependent RNA polymerase [Xinjiang mito-like virus 79]